MKKIFFFILLISAFSVKINAQTYGAWKYGGPGDQSATSIVQCADGGYIAVGNTDSLSDGTGDIFVLRFDSNFNLLWKRTVGGAYGDYAVSVAQANDGGFIIAGSSSSFASPPGNDLDMYIVKLSATGNILWTKTFAQLPSGSFDSGNSMWKAQDGNFVVVGNTGYGGSSAIMFVKFDQMGNTISSGALGESWAQWNGVTSVFPTADGGFAIAGEASATASVYEIYFVKMSSTNTLQWGKEFSAYTTPPLAYNIYQVGEMIQTADHGYAFTGGTNSYFENSNLFFSKCDSIGNVQWVKYLNVIQGTDTIASSLGTSIIQTSDGGYAATGYVQKANYGMRSDIILIKYNSSGAILWSKIIGNIGSDERAVKLIQSSDGGFVIVGTTTLLNSDAYIIKTDSNGNTCQEVASFGTLQTSLLPASSTSGTFFSTTFSTSSGGQLDSAGTFNSICSSSSSMAVSLNGYLSCNGLCEGTLDAIPSGGISPYTYLWSNGLTTDGVFNACKGAYSVTVTDALGNVASASTYLSAMDSIAFTLSTLDATCNTLNDGSASITITSGSPPFSPMWSTGLGTTSVSSLSVGSYWVEVDDDNGCAVVDTFNIGELNPIITNVSAVAAACGTCANGSASTSPTGGVPPYSYNWTGLGMTTPTVTGLLPGTYFVCVSGSNSCYACDSVIVDFTTSVPDSATSNLITVFPNPFSETTMLVVQSSTQNEIYSFELKNVLGKTVRSITGISNKQFQISRNGLENGIYFYKIYSSESIVGVGKLVVQ